MTKFKTNTNKALKYKLVRIDLNNEKCEWNDFVPEKEDVLQEVLAVDKTKLLLNYMHDCKVNIIYDKRHFLTVFLTELGIA